MTESFLILMRNNPYKFLIEFIIQFHMQIDMDVGIPAIARNQLLF